jgi:hypothetical protein
MRGQPQIAASITAAPSSNTRIVGNGCWVREAYVTHSHSDAMQGGA